MTTQRIGNSRLEAIGSAVSFYSAVRKAPNQLDYAAMHGPVIWYERIPELFNWGSMKGVSDVARDPDHLRIGLAWGYDEMHRVDDFFTVQGQAIPHMEWGVISPLFDVTPVGTTFRAIVTARTRKGQTVTVILRKGGDNSFKRTVDVPIHREHGIAMMRVDGLEAGRYTAMFEDKAFGGVIFSFQVAQTVLMTLELANAEVVHNRGTQLLVVSGFVKHLSRYTYKRPLRVKLIQGEAVRDMRVVTPNSHGYISVMLNLRGASGPLAIRLEDDTTPSTFGILTLSRDIQGDSVRAPLNKVGVTRSVTTHPLYAGQPSFNGVYITEDGAARGPILPLSNTGLSINFQALENIQLMEVVLWDPQSDRYYTQPAVRNLRKGETTEFLTEGAVCFFLLHIWYEVDGVLRPYFASVPAIRETPFQLDVSHVHQAMPGEIVDIEIATGQMDELMVVLSFTNAAYNPNSPSVQMGQFLANELERVWKWLGDPTHPSQTVDHGLMISPPRPDYYSSSRKAQPPALPEISSHPADPILLTLRELSAGGPSVQWASGFPVTEMKVSKQQMPDQPGLYTLTFFAINPLDGTWSCVRSSIEVVQEVHIEAHTPEVLAPGQAFLLPIEVTTRTTAGIDAIYNDTRLDIVDEDGNPVNTDAIDSSCTLFAPITGPGELIVVVLELSSQRRVEREYTIKPPEYLPLYAMRAQIYDANAPEVQRAQRSEQVLDIQTGLASYLEGAIASLLLYNSNSCDALTAQYAAAVIRYIRKTNAENLGIVQRLGNLVLTVLEGRNETAGSVEYYPHKKENLIYGPLACTNVLVLRMFESVAGRMDPAVWRLIEKVIGVASIRAYGFRVDSHSLRLGSMHEVFMCYLWALYAKHPDQHSKQKAQQFLDEIRAFLPTYIIEERGDYRLSKDSQYASGEVLLCSELALAAAVYAYEGRMDLAIPMANWVLDRLGSNGQLNTAIDTLALVFMLYAMELRTLQDKQNPQAEQRVLLAYPVELKEDVTVTTEIRPVQVDIMVNNRPVSVLALGQQAVIRVDLKEYHNGDRLRICLAPTLSCPTRSAQLFSIDVEAVSVIEIPVVASVPTEKGMDEVIVQVVNKYHRDRLTSIRTLVEVRR